MQSEEFTQESTLDIALKNIAQLKKLDKCSKKCLCYKKYVC